MAATITIGTLVLAANALTLTGQLAGGAGSGYLPATGLSKVLIKSGGFSYAYVLASATVTSGGVVTIPLSFAIPAGAITVDLLATSNVTDSSANTALGQTAIAVTNNSTAPAATTFPITDPNLMLNGYFTVNTQNARASTTINGTNSQIDFKLTGTDCALLLANNFTAYQVRVSINGSAYVTLPNPDGPAAAWYVVGIPAFTGVAQATYDVSVQLQNSFPNIDNTLAIWARGSVTPTTAKHANFGTAVLLEGSEPKILTNGSTALSGALQGYTNARTPQFEDASFRFRAKTSAIRIWGFQSESCYVLSVDGVDNGTVIQFGASSVWRLIPFWTGLDDTTFHDYTVKVVWKFTASNYWRHLNLPVGPNTPNGGVLDSLAPGAYPVNSVVMLGDSRTEAVQGVPPNSQIGACYKVAQALGVRSLNRGFNATTEHNFVGAADFHVTTSSGEGRVHADITTNAGVGSGVVRAFIDLYGTNDLATMPSIGTAPAGSTALTQATYQASVVAVWTDVLTAFPTATLVIVGISERNDANNSVNATYGIASTSNINRLALNVARQNAVTALAASFPLATIKYVSVEGLFTIVSGAFPQVSADTFDGVHPNNTGHTKLANVLLAAISGLPMPVVQYSYRRRRAA